MTSQSGLDLRSTHRENVPDPETRNNLFLLFSCTRTEGSPFNLSLRIASAFLDFGINLAMCKCGKFNITLVGLEVEGLELKHGPCPLRRQPMRIAQLLDVRSPPA